MYEVFFKSHGVEIEVIDTELNKTFEEELTSDIVSLMASFSARLYGKRSSKNREKNENK
jgi:predicted site-specific integrase-resolvase